MISDKFVRISRARKKFTDLYDMIPEEMKHPETWEAYATELNGAANEVWTLLSGSRDMPPCIEMCLPYGHPEFVDPSDYPNEGE